MSSENVINAYYNGIRVEFSTESNVLLMTYPEFVISTVRDEMINYIKTIIGYNKYSFYIRGTNTVTLELQAFERLNIGLDLNIREISDNGAGIITIFFNNGGRHDIIGTNDLGMNWKGNFTTKPSNIDNRTPNFNLKLPNKNNVMLYDSERISETVMEIDRIMAANNDSDNGMRTISNVNTLRTTVPTKNGEIVYLTAHTYIAATNKTYGGGYFIGTLNDTVTDDNGILFSNPAKTFSWRRVINSIESLTVCDWGAIPDGITDCKNAVLAMYNYTRSQNNILSNIGIQFPAGEFALSNIDISASEISRFRMAGPKVEFGYHVLTRLNLIGAENKPAVLTQSRFTEISGIYVNGGYKVATPTTNIRGFFENTVQGGAFIRVNCFRSENFGKRVFYFLDSLDTKFDQIYGQYLYDGFIEGSWSGRAEGSWDHMTAVELSNGNFHLCYNKPVITLPRCTQSFIRNFWIEHSDYSLDINNGDWEISGLNIEDVKNPADFTYAQICAVRPIGLQSGASITYSNPNKSRWLNTYEMGNAVYGARGAHINGSLAASYTTGNVQIANTDANNPIWVEIGTFIAPRSGDCTVFRITGARGTELAVNNTKDYNGNDFGGGELILRCRRPNANNLQDVFAEVRGTNPVKDFKIYRKYVGWVQLYVQLYPNSGNLNCFIETTSPSRYLAGICFEWNSAYKVISDTDFAKLNLTSVGGQASWGTPNAGIFFNTGNELGLQAKMIADGLVVNMNGTPRVLPYSALLALPSLSDSFNRTGDVGASKMDHYFGGSGDGTWIAGNAGAVCNNGVLNVNVAAGSSVDYRTDIPNATFEFKLESGPTFTTEAVNATFDFRRPRGGNGVDCYRLQMWGKDAGKNTKIRLIKRISNATTTISTADSTVIDSQTIKIVNIGTNIKVYVDNKLIWNIDDTSLPDGGVIAFATGSGNTGYSVSNMKIYNGVK